MHRNIPVDRPGVGPVVPKILRRTAVAACVMASIVVAGCSAQPASDDATSEPALSGQIIWADFGGPTNEARQLAYFDEFSQATGVDVVSVSRADAMVNSMVTGGEGDYDAIHFALDQAYRFQDGLAQLPADVPRDEELPDDIQDYAFGTFIVGHALGYMTDTFPGGGPETWTDFWDVERFPGLRAWPGSPGSYDSSCEVALLSQGVAQDDLYPLDLERCTTILDELRPHMVFYTSYPEVQQLLVSGSAAMALSPTGQYSALKNAGEDITISWNQAIVAPNVIVVPKTAPNKENVFALATFMSAPERQAVFVERTLYGPGNPATFDLLSEEVREGIITDPAHDQIVWQNSRARAEQAEELLKWYTDWLAQ